MINGQPLVSVITPVYNGERYVARTIASILGQTFSDFEYILVDDASTDSSLSIIKSFNDPRIRIIENEVNSRLVFSRNRGLEAARGKYIALIDHDDIALPHRLERQLKAMESDSSLVLIGSQMRYINEQDQVTSTRSYHRCESPEHCRAKLLFRNHFVNSSILFRQLEKPVLLSDQFQLAEDYDFIERYAAFGRIHVLDEALVHYREHDNNYSGKMQIETQAGCIRIKQRQLERLGFHVDEQLSELHALFEYEPVRYTPENLQKLASLAIQIIEANAMHQVFDPKALRDVTRFELLTIAEHAAKNSPVGWRDIFSGPYRSVLFDPPSGALRAALKYMRSRMI
jgi:glycosyltransferase involved in cell wall biosynthesis